MVVLVAEDDDVTRRVIEVKLNQWSYDSVLCKNGDEAWEVLQRPDAPQLAILDWMMPGLDGAEICRRLRRRTAGNLRLRSTTPYTYVIMVTGQVKQSDVIAGLEAGADDYVTKPFNPQELEVRLRAGKRIIELQSALFATQQILSLSASTDSLTDALNHGAIMDVLRHELDRSRREQSSLSVIMGDLDKFKQINDTYQHQGGDAVLKEAVKRMKATVRPYDAVGRYGGEEFLVVLPGCGAEDARVAAERIREAIGSKPVTSSSGPIPVTISLGYAVRRGRQSATAEALVHAADTALYHAKHMGRNRVEAADELAETQ